MCPRPEGLKRKCHSSPHAAWASPSYGTKAAAFEGLPDSYAAREAEHENK